MAEIYRCPNCAAPEVRLREDGKVDRHTRWYIHPILGPERLRSYCIGGEGRDPVRVSD